MSSEGTAGMNTSVCSEGFSSLSGFFCFFFFFWEGGRRGDLQWDICSLVLLLNCLFCFVTCWCFFVVMGGGEGGSVLFPNFETA